MDNWATAESGNNVKLGRRAARTKVIKTATTQRKTRGVLKTYYIYKRGGQGRRKKYKKKERKRLVEKKIEDDRRKK